MVSYLLHHDTLLQNAIEVYYKIGHLFHYKMRQFYYEMRQLLQNASIQSSMGLGSMKFIDFFAAISKFYCVTVLW